MTFSNKSRSTGSAVKRSEFLYYTFTSYQMNTKIRWCFIIVSYITYTCLHYTRSILCCNRFLEDILDATVDLCATQPLGGSSGSWLSPLHVVALVDPKAGWFIKWMVGISCMLLSCMLAKSVELCIIQVHVHIRSKSKHCWYFAIVSCVAWAL